MQSTNESPQFGELITDGETRRDAIHIAVAPVTAVCDLEPGQDIGFVRGNRESVGPCENPIGIVDPFLKDTIKAGQRFWLFLYPNTVTGMRHFWKHPAFTYGAIENA
ncbi:MAG: hypothetical protein KDA84_00025 [Planctomycetaceae bacterium]|nr:hypothetical protein [Planctomycetaceae bacterium]